MINPRIKLLLDPHFIRFAADSYQWALDAKKEYDELSEKQQREVDTYRRGVSYAQTAIDLINVEFKDVLAKESLGELGRDDAKRAWRIVHRRPPSDPLGLAYVWFITRISLYVPDRKGRVHHPLSSELNRNEIIQQLFHQFLDWAEKGNHLGSLSPKPENPAFIDEIEGLFVSTIDVLTQSNPYVQQIFKNTDWASEMVPTELIEDSNRTETVDLSSTPQSKAN